MLPALSVHAEPVILPNTASPARGLVFAFDDQAHTLWLVRLRDHVYLASAASRDFYGRLSDFSACWCRDARRVAVTTGGRVERLTTVFAYTGHSLKEMDLPNPGYLRDRWFPDANPFRGNYIEARRWRGPNLLELSFSGTAIYGDGKTESDYREYNLTFLVKFGSGGSAKIVHVTDDIHPH